METAHLSESQQREKKQLERAKMFLLYMGIGSMVMTFAGITSAIIVQEGQKNWYDYTLPNVFIISTLILLLSSFTMHLALGAAKKNEGKKTGNFTLITFVLGLAFMAFQFQGWQILVDSGLYFSDMKNISGSFFYTITALHMVHLVGGLIALLVTMVNAYRNKYSDKNYLGIKLSTFFWHFLDILWLYLFIFLLLKSN